MHGFQGWLAQLDFSMVWDYVVIIAASLLCIMFHEVCHGLTALKLGDTTAKDAGRLTFNPIKHIDLWGLLMMAVFKFGWAKAVPVDILSVGLAVFNVIPIPPLDGSKVLGAFLPKKVYYQVLRYERYGFLLLMAVLYLGILDTPLNFCRYALIDGLSKI